MTKKLRKVCTTGLAAAVFSLSATSAVAAFPIFGKKKTDDLPARKLTPAQSQLVDKAIARESEVIKVIPGTLPPG